MNIAAYRLGLFGANTASIVMANGVSLDLLASLASGVEYSAGSLLINHAKTLGIGSCVGCDVPMCFVMQRMIVTTPGNLNNVTMLGGADGPYSAVATWQDGAALDLHVASTLLGPLTSIGSCVLASTPARASRWGAVKALYR
jgi:hypothetical protein